MSKRVTNSQFGMFGFCPPPPYIELRIKNVLPFAAIHLAILSPKFFGATCVLLAFVQGIALIVNYAPSHRPYSSGHPIGHIAQDIITTSVLPTF